MRPCKFARKRTVRSVLMNYKSKCLLAIKGLLLLTVSNQVSAANLQYLIDLSLEELMDVVVITASKTEEKLKRAPVSISSVNREQILAQGITSIPEALRLIPGLLVKESPSGVFGVYSRGLDCPYASCDVADSTQKSLLVMVDRRPVYNYYLGGIWWEALSVGIHDLERIEVIRGPSASLYGPNAVDGVIHLITRKNDGSDKTSSEVIVNSNPHSSNHVYVTRNQVYKGGQLKLTFNNNRREREARDYFHYHRGEFVSVNEVVSSGTATSPSERFPEPELAFENQGVNIFWNKTDGAKLINFAMGHQESLSQQSYTANGVTPLSSFDSLSHYFDIKYQSTKSFSQLSYQGGRLEVLGLPELRYSFDNIDAIVERLWEWDSFRFTLGGNFRESTYDGDFINGRRSILTRAYYLQLDTTMFKHWRVNTSLRADDYNEPDGVFWNGLFSVQNFLSDDRSWRITLGRSYQSPQIFRSYLDLEVGVPGVFVFRTLGDQELEPLCQDMVEWGYRSKLWSRAFFEMELFAMKTEQYRRSKSITPFLYQYETIDHQVEREGVTLSVEHPLNGNGTIKYHVTWVNIDRSSQVVDPRDNPEWESPSWYGGVRFNTQILQSWYLNIYGNIYDEQIITRNNAGESLVHSQKINKTLWLNTNLTQQLNPVIRLSFGMKHLRIGDNKQNGLIENLSPLAYVQLEAAL